MLKTRITEILGIRHPILQGGMAWITGWEMAASVCEAGGLGTIAAATMEPQELIESIQNIRKVTEKPFAVNIPLRLPTAQRAVEIAMEEQVPVIISSAGDPLLYAEDIKRRGITILQVAFSVDMVRRCNKSGVDGIIAMGAEGGGNISPAEISTLVLVSEVTQETDLPVVAAGGICDGKGLAAALALGAEGIQMGTRFLATREATLHDNYKKAIIDAIDTDTIMTGRTTGLQFRVRKNSLAEKVLKMEKEGKPRDEIDSFTIGSLKKAAMEGDTKWGSLMMGQISGMIQDIKPVGEMLDEIVSSALEQIRLLGRYLS
ncbi:MAG TPA: nitronate monooxygenase [Desulfobacteraceae bacterium]|nr:nitronate monooxygenase [Desulfobacteraceae bacterium]HPJ66873.1 nitronate monooxygenase [Desulfobacteraceae bacterium]HPQ27668.1 nitronate monooxygenase [Desulfobacteraceae bacterium]